MVAEKVLASARKAATQSNDAPFAAICLLKKKCFQKQRTYAKVDSRGAGHLLSVFYFQRTSTLHCSLARKAMVMESSLAVSLPTTPPK